jgi:hypothetical protein
MVITGVAKGTSVLSVPASKLLASPSNQRVNAMIVTETEIPDVLIIEPKLFGDQRGFFLETFQVERYQSHGIKGPFVQDNLSRSAHGVLRGLHLQNPNTQGKLVSVMRGRCAISRSMYASAARRSAATSRSNCPKTIAGNSGFRSASRTALSCSRRAPISSTNATRLTVPVTSLPSASFSWTQGGVAAVSVGAVL